MSRSTRRNILQPVDWWQAFEEQAAREGMSLSAWIGQQCLAGLDCEAADQLSERPPPHRPKRVACMPCISAAEQQAPYAEE